LVCQFINFYGQREGRDQSVAASLPVCAAFLIASYSAARDVIQADIMLELGIHIVVKLLDLCIDQESAAYSWVALWHIYGKIRW